MNPELEKLATHRLSRAQDAFAEGDYLLTKKAFMGAVNRFYYPPSMQRVHFSRFENSTHRGTAA